MYRKILILILILLLPFYTFSQEKLVAKNAAEFESATKNCLPREEEKSKEQRYKIIMFGNSITTNGKWSEGLGRQDVKNSGMSGFTTSHFVWIIRDKVLQYDPDICFLEGGINDIGVGIPLERIFRNYESLVDTLLRHNIFPVLQSTLYVNFPNNEKSNIFHNQMVESLNIFLKGLASSRNIQYMDLNQYLSKDKKLKKEYTIDGVHINHVAYKIWYAFLIETLNSIYSNHLNFN